MVGHLQKLWQKKARKILKREKQENPKKNQIPSPHLIHEVGVVGAQLQPGVEDGWIPTEVVAKEKKENPKNKKTRKQENPKKGGP
jgi:hypothetical protein